MSKIKSLLLITALIDAIYAVALVFMPDKFVEMHGLQISDAAIFTTRLLSPAVISDCLLALFGITLLQSREAQRAIALKFFLSWGIGGVVILLGKLTIETMSAIAWVDVGFAAIFTLIWGYYLFAKPKVT